MCVYIYIYIYISKSTFYIIYMYIYMHVSLSLESSTPVHIAFLTLKRAVCKWSSCATQAVDFTLYVLYT